MYDNITISSLREIIHFNNDVVLQLSNFLEHKGIMGDKQMLIQRYYYVSDI